MTPGAGGAIVAHGPSEPARFSLSFDDGPSPCTERLLDVLAGAGVKATFFMVGSQLRREPGIGAQVRDAGHEIGVHSMQHLDHAEVGREEAVADIADGAAAIEQALGVTPRLYRAPYGHFVPGTLAEAERRGWTCVHWSAWGEDWREDETRESIAARAIVDLRPGAIVLLHDGRREQAIECERVLGAVEDVLAEARRRELEPVTVGELLGLRGQARGHA
jgi:peptidoglycan-N-acetylglucosamine deacetylase